MYIFSLKGGASVSDSVIFDHMNFQHVIHLTVSRTALVWK